MQTSFTGAVEKSSPENCNFFLPICLHWSLTLKLQRRNICPMNAICFFYLETLRTEHVVSLNVIFPTTFFLISLFLSSSFLSFFLFETICFLFAALASSFFFSLRLFLLQTYLHCRRFLPRWRVITAIFALKTWSSRLYIFSLSIASFNRSIAPSRMPRSRVKPCIFTRIMRSCSRRFKRASLFSRFSCEHKSLL